MSLIPEFELGLSNAWILILSFLLLFTAWEILNRLRGQKGSSRSKIFAKYMDNG